MPGNIVKSFAKKTGKTKEEVEKLWNKAKAIAAKAGRAEDYAYIVSMLKRMLKLKKPVHAGLSLSTIFLMKINEDGDANA